MRHCPKCEYSRAYVLADGRNKCKACGTRCTSRTVWPSSRLFAWFTLGVPVYRQHFCGVASRPATKCFYRRLRPCCANAGELREPFEIELECDETTFGGTRKGKLGWGVAGKVIVFGIVKRDGQAKALPIAAHSRSAVMTHIQAQIREGSLYSTDE